MFMQGEAVDQGAAGDQHQLDITGAQLAPRERIQQRGFGHADDLGIVLGQLGRAAVIKIFAAGDDLEMRRVAHRPAQIGGADGAKPRQRIAGAHLASISCGDLGAEMALRFLGHRGQQRSAVLKVAKRRPRRHPGAARRLPHADRFRPALLDQRQRRFDQDPSQITVMIGFRRPRRPAAWRCGLAAAPADETLAGEAFADEGLAGRGMISCRCVIDEGCVDIP